MPCKAPKRACKSDEELRLCFNHWSKLPEDLKVEILCRLPCKQLIMLKCVSKSWHLVITSRCAPIVSSTSLCGIIFTHHVLDDGHFFLSACLNLKISLLPGTKLMFGISYLMEQLVPFTPQPEELQDCCNGVFLIAHFASVPRQYYVCNPTTHQCIEVPVNWEHTYNTYNASLVFDPSVVDCPSLFMVVVPREYSKHSLKMDIFSSNLGSWSSHIVLLDSVVDGSKVINRSHVYSNGVLYMLSLDKYLVSVFLKSTNDVGSKLYSLAIELPGKHEFDCCGSLGVSRGDLLYSNSDGQKIVVWVLGSGGACWILQHRISVKNLVANPRVIDPEEDRLYVRDYKSGEGLVEVDVAAKVYAFHPFSEEIFIVTRHQILKFNTRTKQVRESRVLSSRLPVLNMYPVSCCPVILDSVSWRNQKSDQY